MINLKICCGLVSILLMLANCAFAQTPDAAPTTEPAAPYKAQVPAGFARAELDGRDFLLDPQETEWLQGVLDRAGPTTVPATMPSDVLARFDTGRNALKQRIMRDLALADPKPIDDYFEDRLGGFLRRMDGYRPPIVYLLVTPDRLKQIIKEGWADPRFYYNRAADDVIYSSRVNLSLESDDEVVVPLMQNPALAADVREQQVVNQMRAVEQQVLGSVAGETLALTTAGLVELVASLAVPQEDIPSDQEWLVVGVAGVLGARYVADLSGMDPQRLLDDLTRSVPANPVRAETIDLLNPTKLGDLRPEWVRAHLDAYRRRAMSAVRALLAEAGDEGLTRVLVEFRKSPPQDGAALVKLIQQQTGVDVTPQLRPK